MLGHGALGEWALMEMPIDALSAAGFCLDLNVNRILTLSVRPRRYLTLSLDAHHVLTLNLRSETCDDC